MALSNISADELTEKLWDFTDKTLIDAYYDALGIGALPGLRLHAFAACNTK